MLGLRPEIIAKFIGHASVQTTQRVYSRFNVEELTALVDTVPLFGDCLATTGDGLKERWRATVKRLQDPYEFSEREWMGLSRVHGQC
jgi:hypothetical protein